MGKDNLAVLKDDFVKHSVDLFETIGRQAMETRQPQTLTITCRIKINGKGEPSIETRGRASISTATLIRKARNNGGQLEIF